MRKVTWGRASLITLKSMGSLDGLFSTSCANGTGAGLVSPLPPPLPLWGGVGDAVRPSLAIKYTLFTEQLAETILNWADPQGVMKESPTRHYPLADLPSALLVALTYLTLVFIGTAVMRTLPIKPIRLYGLQFTYNLLQMLVCSYMCVEAVLQTYRNYGLGLCLPYNPTAPLLGPLLWLFYISKALDFCDTAFIILAKKWTQLSFLHVYHHFSIFLECWLLLNAGFDGDIWLLIFLNSGIHAIMYTYYFLCLHAKNIWWKRYLTVIQIIQFLGLHAQGITVVGCDTYPRRVAWVNLVYVFSVLVLFVDFYTRTYVYNSGSSSSSVKKATIGGGREQQQPQQPQQPSQSNFE